MESKTVIKSICINSIDSYTGIQNVEKQILFQFFNDNFNNVSLNALSFEIILGKSFQIIFAQSVFILNRIIYNLGIHFC